MGFIIRVAISLSLVGVFIVAPLIGWSQVIGGTSIGAFFDSVSDFIEDFSDIFINVRGLINYFISAAVGSPAVTAFNILINIGLFFPIFAYATRFVLGLKTWII